MTEPFTTRRAYAAAHVVADGDGEIDWESTLAFRDHLWSHGFGVAEAMDTAQRGMGLDWPSALELIRRTAARAPDRPGALCAGAGTDQLSGDADLSAVADAYAEQVEAVDATGATVVVMASRALAAAAGKPADYRAIYVELLSGVRRPVILHWLGEMFDPALAGYWGSDDFEAAAATVLGIIEACPGAVDGVKLSVLDAEREIWLRRRLPDGVRMYTGDDFGYAELIEGDALGHSDALLGALAAITVPAAEALTALDTGDVARYRELIAPTVPLARALFEAPTWEYKAGVAFLAYLNGLQPTFTMLDGFEHRRSPEHLVRVYELARAAGALADPDLAVLRLHEHIDSVAAG